MVSIESGLVLSLAFVVCLAVLWWLHQSAPEDSQEHPLGYEDKPQQKQLELPKEQDFLPDMLTIYVTPQIGHIFNGYELLQSFSACGLHFGEHRLFHRHNDEGDILFSVSSASAPGHFDLHELGQHQYPNGIAVFMHLKRQNSTAEDLELFWQNAKLLADELGGFLCDAKRQPMNEAQFKRWQSLLANCDDHQPA